VPGTHVYHHPPPVHACCIDVLHHPSPPGMISLCICAYTAASAERGGAASVLWLWLCRLCRRGRGRGPRQGALAGGEGAAQLRPIQAA
jgi:hypothetical protein